MCDEGVSFVSFFHFLVRFLLLFSSLLFSSLLSCLSTFSVTVPPFLSLFLSLSDQLTHHRCSSAPGIGWTSPRATAGPSHWSERQTASAVAALLCRPFLAAARAFFLELPLLPSSSQLFSGEESSLTMSATCARASKASVPRRPSSERKSLAQSDGTAPRGATTRSGTTNSKASTVAAPCPPALARGLSKSRARKGAAGRESGSGMETMAWEARGEDVKAAAFFFFFFEEREKREREFERVEREIVSAKRGRK